MLENMVLEHLKTRSRYRYFNMDSPSDLFLTNTNYFSWKSLMEDVLRSKDCTRSPGEKNKNPIMTKNKPKWDKIMVKHVD